MTRRLYSSLLTVTAPAGVEVSFPCKTFNICSVVTFLSFNWFGSSIIDNSEVDFPKT